MSMNLTKQELDQDAAHLMAGGNVADRSLDELRRLMTVSQYVTDLCLNEIERRGELTFIDGVPIVPYQSDYTVATILTR
jgi:hypothetical protein